MKIEVQSISFDGARPPVVCYAKILVDGWLCVRSLRLCHTHDGRWFVSMPQHREADGTWTDQVFPIGPAGRKAVHDAVMAAYQGSRT
jgi:DNA-binding cell septation regulator SpoVG